MGYSVQTEGQVGTGRSSKTRRSQKNQATELTGDIRMEKQAMSNSRIKSPCSRLVGGVNPRESKKEGENPRARRENFEKRECQCLNQGKRASFVTCISKKDNARDSQFYNEGVLRRSKDAE